MCIVRIVHIRCMHERSAQAARCSHVLHVVHVYEGLKPIAKKEQLDFEQSYVCLSLVFRAIQTLSLGLSAREMTYFLVDKYFACLSEMMLGAHDT